MNASSKKTLPAGPQKKPSMKSLGSRALNLFLWLSFCCLAGTGLMLAFRLPPGSRGGRGLSALGLDRHEWGDVHTWLGYVFIVLILLHLLVHWRWLWQFASRRKAMPMIAGMGAGVALLLALALIPVDKKEDGGHGGRGKERHQNSSAEHE
jgi:cytochrome b561